MNQIEIVAWEGKGQGGCLLCMLVFNNLVSFEGVVSPTVMFSGCIYTNLAFSHAPVVNFCTSCMYVASKFCAYIM